MRPSDSPLARQHVESTNDPGEDEAVPAAPMPARSRASTVTAAALVVIALLLLGNLLAIRALTVETRRVACYERLSFITSQLGDTGLTLPAEGTARACEGMTPLVEYQDGGASEG